MILSVCVDEDMPPGYFSNGDSLQLTNSVNLHESAPIYLFTVFSVVIGH